ncbi:hypothetical protein PR003_g11093 [Phytophthora rubi]|uniref:BZIP domain-containing protein n=1 Tax=Phytophthora rubi TaxID=129364 RepID=A0A6A3MU75_9STRA|nr:hypothetical protein PR001_g10632 [Phytophthora rubi]KAE9339272.1 hypothetical protein PR003_g11093 [Phytophthora rubi]
MDDLDAMHPTAGYLFAEELDVHFTDLNSTLLLLDAADCCFSLLQPSGSCAAPSSPSSVAFLPPHYPPSPVKPTAFSPLDDAAVFIKPEPLHDVIEHSFLTPVPTVTNERERLRCRQRGYEKRYRGRKRKSLNMQRDTWLALEMKLAAARRKHCKPYVRQTQSSLQYKMLLLLQEERALVEDRVAMKSLQAWEHITRIREYADKDALRTVSEWRHSAVKVIGPCGVLAPGRFHPYAPMEQLHFTW